MDNKENQMNLGFEEYPDLKTSVIPSFDQLLASKRIESVSNNKNDFDPYKLMIQKKKSDGGEINPNDVKKWPEKDIKSLETFCKEYGIIGFNAGKMPPLVALALLKKNLGIVDTTVSNSVPEECKKIHRYNPGYPYTEMIRNKTLIKG